MITYSNKQLNKVLNEIYISKFTPYVSSVVNL